MKNRNKLIKESIFQRRGFYLALYSAIGIVMLGAVGITYSTINSLEKNKKRAVEVDFNKMQNTIKDNSKSYKELENNKSNEESVVVNKTDDDSIPRGVYENDIKDKKEEIFKEDVKKEEIFEEDVKKEEIFEEETKKEEVPKKETKINLPKKAKKQNVINKTFEPFGENDEMNWPIDGSLAMEYSVDKVIYDKTLDQFRTNDNIKIAGPIGSEVRSSADGEVKYIGKTKEEGNIVTIEHGNGWLTTYSQLGEDIKVSEGDIVSRGEIIGFVGEPTIYYCSLGSHVCFKVTKEGYPVDPSKILLEQ